MHVLTEQQSIKKMSPESKMEQRGAHGSAWRKERKGVNAVII